MNGPSLMLYFTKRFVLSGEHWKHWHPSPLYYPQQLGFRHFWYLGNTNEKKHALHPLQWLTIDFNNVLFTISAALRYRETDQKNTTIILRFFHLYFLFLHENRNCSKKIWNTRIHWHMAIPYTQHDRVKCTVYLTNIWFSS